jgi:hypothetical protein
MKKGRVLGLLLIAGLSTQIANAYKFQFTNKSSKEDIGVCLKFVGCSDQCWFTLKAGQTWTHDSGGCLASSLEFTSLNGGKGFYINNMLAAGWANGVTMNVYVNNFGHVMRE